MAYCPSCGTKNFPDAAYCDECGNRLPIPVTAQQPEVIPMPAPSQSKVGASATAGRAQTAAVRAVAAPDPARNVPSRQSAPERVVVEVEEYALRDRYEHAYESANSMIEEGKSMIANGNIVKVVGWFLAAIIGGAGIALFANLRTAILQLPIGIQEFGAAACIILGIIVGVHYQSKGSSVCAQGRLLCAHSQQILALLDCAVHTSPFMSDTLRAKIMSLPLKGLSGTGSRGSTRSLPLSFLSWGSE